MVYFQLAAGKAAGDLFSISHTLVTRLAGLLGLVLVLFVGAKALGHIGQDRHGAAVGLVLVALIPAWFILDPAGATNTLKSTIHSISGG